MAGTDRRTMRRAAAVGLLALTWGLLAAGPAPQEPLPAGDPVAFLQKCLKHLDGLGLSGYRLRLDKQERIDGKLQPGEDVEVCLREKPYGIFMRWLKGARGADRALYVRGENADKVLVHPAGLAGDFVKVVALNLDSPRVRDASRYGIQEVGLRPTLERTLDAWRADQARGVGRTEYLGVVPVHEVGDRPCYMLRHTLPAPGEDGITQTTAYIDRETWFQVATVLKGPDGELIGAYFYRDIVLNPEFAPDQFEPAALTR